MTANIQQKVLSRSTHQTVALVSGISILIFLTLLGFFYLQQVFDTASRNSDIHALETSILQLKEKARSLELESAQLRSMQTIEQMVPKLNLVATDQVAYLAPDTAHVALLNAR